MIKCLRNWDIVLFCCDLNSQELLADWVQINPAKLNDVLGTQQVLKQPKTVDSLIYTVTVPENLAAVHTDVRFPLISVDSGE